MALRFHPDKALANCRFAVRLSRAGAALAGARAIQDRIRSEADWLFICIGEARTVLEDAGKRAQVPLTRGLGAYQSVPDNCAPQPCHCVGLAHATHDEQH